MHATCPICHCSHPHPAHAVLAALTEGDLDLALRLHLLEAPPCPCCSTDCATRLEAARAARQGALDARERYRGRALRLARIQADREAARRTPPKPAATTASPSPALPGAAAAALARALAKARERHA